MQLTHVTADRRNEWNAFVAREPSFALLHSWEWGEFKERSGWKAFRVAIEERGQMVASAQMFIKPLLLPGLAGSVVYVPRGPVGNWLEGERIFRLLSELHGIARRHRAVFLKIEPPLLHDPTIEQMLGQHSFWASPHANQPCATIVMDLMPGLDDVLAHMHSKTCYNVRYATKIAVVV